MAGHRLSLTTRSKGQRIGERCGYLQINTTAHCLVNCECIRDIHHSLRVYIGRRKLKAIPCMQAGKQAYSRQASVNDSEKFLDSPYYVYINVCQRPGAIAQCGTARMAGGN